MNQAFFNDWNLLAKDDAQLSALQAKRNTVVIAGPGSGKTRVLAIKAIDISYNELNAPSGLACISYSREAVRELERRLHSYGHKPNSRDFVGTVHSFSLLHVLQPYARLFPEYNVKHPIRILPKDQANLLLEKVKKKMRITERIDLSEVNRQRSLSVPGRSTTKFPSSDLILNAASIYEELLISSEYIDFTSIINISAKMINEQSFIRESISSRFPWLLVDEYQDLGKALHEMVTGLILGGGIKLFAVGDTNQSIYGFNGGYPHFLEELSHLDDVNSIRLKNNYRSSQHIINASIETLQLTPPIPEYTARKRTDAADFLFITCKEGLNDQIDLLVKKLIPKFQSNNIPFNEIGIITDSNRNVQQIASILRANHLPVFVAKWNFDNSAVVTWLQDLAAWVSNQSSQSFDNLFYFWHKLLREHKDDRYLDKIGAKVAFHEILERSRSSTILVEWLIVIIEGLGLLATLYESHMYPDEKENLDRLINEATTGNLQNTSVEKFGNLGEPENEITVTTRHSCKGLEFEVVVMLGMEEGNFPSYKNLDNPEKLAEDQRLCYVCVSRSKKTCILVRSETYWVTLPPPRSSFSSKKSPSRFWNLLQAKFGSTNNSLSAEKITIS